MQVIKEWQLRQLREQYPAGTRVELIYMNDPYNHKLVPGCQGTVRWVDDMGLGLRLRSWSYPRRGRLEESNRITRIANNI